MAEKPYYQDDAAGIVIYHGDCRDVLPSIGSVDITISSPPYNTIAVSTPSGMMVEANRKFHNAYETHSDDMPENEYGEWMRDVFEQCRKVTRGIVWINHKTRYREKSGIHPLAIFPWPYYSEIVWDRGGSITLNARKFAPSHEFIYGFGTPHYWDNSVNTLMSVWRIPPEREVVGHPCPFPLSIASRCIVASCPPDGIVLDPFMGSGTTLAAAKLAGRRAIGIEISEEYCELAVSRLQQGVLFGADHSAA